MKASSSHRPALAKGPRRTKLAQTRGLTVATRRTGAFRLRDLGRRQEVLAEATRLACSARTDEGTVDQTVLPSLLACMPPLGASPHEAAVELLGGAKVGIAPVDDNAGRSSSSVFYIVDRHAHPIYVAKVVDAVELAQQLSSMAGLSALTSLWRQSGRSLSRITTIGRMESPHGSSPRTLMIMAREPGQPHTHLMLQARYAPDEGLRQAALKRLRQALSGAATWLGDLHSAGPAMPLARNYVDGNIAEILRLFEEARPQLEAAGLPVERMRRRLSQLIAAFSRNPGPAAYVQGDANPGNFLFFEQVHTSGDIHPRLGVIDYGTFHTGMNARGLPRRSPAFDLEWALFWNEAWLWRCVRPAESSSLRDLYRSNYEKRGPSGLEDARALFAPKILLGEIACANWHGYNGYFTREQLLERLEVALRDFRSGSPRPQSPRVGFRRGDPVVLGPHRGLDDFRLKAS